MTFSLVPSLRALSSNALAAAAIAAPLAAQTYLQMPAGYRPTDVTPDGAIVVGTGPGGSFVWRWRIDPTPTTVAAGLSVVGTSDDGSVLAGTAKNVATGRDEAAIWTAAGGVQLLGGLGDKCDFTTSTAYGISGDGSAVVGLGYQTLCGARGFRWTAATGMQPLQFVGLNPNRCTAISRDGSTMGGFAQGSFSRTPAYWGDPYGGTNGAILNMSDLGEVYGFNNDGSVSVGTYYFPVFNEYRGYTRTKFGGVMTPLPHLNAGWKGNAMDISEDGKTIVGFDSQQLALIAWVWTEADGILSLNTRLANAGIPNVPALTACVACSDDGNVIVGGGGIGGPGFIVQLKAMSPYGTGTPGCTGAEILDGPFAPKVGEVNFALTCTNAPPSSLGLGLITNAQDYAGSDPFGLNLMLHVDFFTSTETSTYDMGSDITGFGFSSLPLPNDPGLVGKTYYSQVVWAWSSPLCPAVLPYGLSSSNGLTVRILP